MLVYNYKDLLNKGFNEAICVFNARSLNTKVLKYAVSNTFNIIKSLPCSETTLLVKSGSPNNTWRTDYKSFKVKDLPYLGYVPDASLGISPVHFNRIMESLWNKIQRNSQIKLDMLEHDRLSFQGIKHILSNYDEFITFYEFPKIRDIITDSNDDENLYDFNKIPAYITEELLRDYKEIEFG